MPALPGARSSPTRGARTPVGDKEEHAHCLSSILSLYLLLPLWRTGCFFSLLFFFLKKQRTQIFVVSISKLLLIVVLRFKFRKL